MSHILPDNLFQELAARLVDGVSNLLNTEIPSEEVVSLLTMNNLPTVAKTQSLLTKQSLKRNVITFFWSSSPSLFHTQLGHYQIEHFGQKI